MKTYRIPTLFILKISSEDILTSSPGTETPILDEEMLEE